MTADQRFEIGEVAIYWRPGAVGHGQDVTIASGLISNRKGRDFYTGRPLADGYRVRERGPANGGRWTIGVKWLRKKRPPRDDLELVRWDECQWKPEKVNV